MEVQKIKIRNLQRQQKNNKQKLNHLTPQKYLNRQSMCRTVNRLQKKFGYDYDFQQSKPLKYLRQQFLNSTVDYLGKGQWTKKMGRKDKYEKNIQCGKPLKKNPLFKIFNKIQYKITEAKTDCFQLIKSKFAN